MSGARNLLFSTKPAGGTPPSFVKATNGATDSVVTSLNTSVWGSNTTAGNSIWVGVTWDNSGSGAPTITVADATNGSYTASALGKGTDTRHDQYMQVFYHLNITGGSTAVVTASASGNMSYVRIVAIEVSGAKTSSAEDQTGQNMADAGTSLDIATLTPGNDNQLILAWGMLDSGAAGSTWTANAGFTIGANSKASAGNYEMAAEYKQITTAASTAIGLTLSSTNDCIGQTVTIKSA